jgi:hypothetical protein
MIATLFGLALPAPLAAGEKPERSGRAATPGESAGDDALPDNADRADRSGQRAEAHGQGKMPENAAAALARATAAYEYGDMNQVVEAARPVTEGLLPASPDEQAQAFRSLGIGLYLTNRPLGAEAAFTELLRRDPRARLDPTTTRPELVAFFQNIRHQQLARQSSARRVIWNFIPPVGQFQNGDNVKGWVVLGVGVASLATLASSYFVLKSWEHNPGHTYPGHENSASTLRTVNWVGAGVLAATYVYGVFDGLIGYGKPIEEEKSSASLHFYARGGGLGFAF